MVSLYQFILLKGLFTNHLRIYVQIMKFSYVDQLKKNTDFNNFEFHFLERFFAGS